MSPQAVSLLTGCIVGLSVALGAAKIAVPGGPGTGLAVLVRPAAARRLMRGLGLVEVVASLAALASERDVRLVGLSLCCVVLILGAPYAGWLRRRHPEASCGCAGAASMAGVSRVDEGRAWTVATVAVFTLIAQGGWSAPIRGSGGGVGAALGLAVATSYIRRPRWPRTQAGSQTDPSLNEVGGDCAHARGRSLEEALGALRASSAWHDHLGRLASVDVGDQWREGCHRFVSFPAIGGGDMVFAVHVLPHAGAVRAAHVPAGAAELPLVAS